MSKWCRRRKDPRNGEVYYEHRAVAEWKLGQPLKFGVTVHHKNRGCDDNHPRSCQTNART